MTDQDNAADQDVTADTTGGDAQTAGSGAGSTNTGASATAGGADAGKTFTQAELDEIVEKRLARVKAKPDPEKDALAARVAEFERLAEERRLADLSEDERKEEARVAAETRAADLEAALAAERSGRLRADVILADPEAVRLPNRYKAGISGNTAEEIAASIAEIKAEYAADAEAIRAGSKLPPPDLGSGGVTKAVHPNAATVDEKLFAAQQQPAGAKRDNALIEALTAKP